MGEGGPEFRPPCAPGLDFFLSFWKEKRKRKEGERVCQDKDLLNKRGTGRQRRDGDKLQERERRKGERERGMVGGRNIGNRYRKRNNERRKEGERKREMRKMAIKGPVNRRGWALCSCRCWPELSPQPCGRQRWVAPEILTCQTPSPLRGPNQN